MRGRTKHSGDGLFATICRGAAAGLAGTAAMTLSSTLEAKLRGREPSDAPVEAASKMLGIAPADEDKKSRVSNLVHWGYGTSWGTVRGLFDRAGLSPAGATAAHLGSVWGAAAVMLPALDVTPPVWEWGAKEVAVDLLHHGVYAGATAIAYEALD